MKNHNCNQESNPVTSLEHVRIVLSDVEQEQFRLKAILINMRDFFYLAADHEDEIPSLDHTFTGHILSDAIDHLEMLYAQIQCMQELTSYSTPRTSDAQKPWESLRRVFAACDEDERRLVLQTTRAVQGHMPVRDKLSQFLHELTAKPEGGGDE